MNATNATTIQDFADRIREIRKDVKTLASGIPSPSSVRYILTQVEDGLSAAASNLDQAVKEVAYLDFIKNRRDGR